MVVVVVVVVVEVCVGLAAVAVVVLAGPRVEDSPLHPAAKKASAMAMMNQRMAPRYKASAFVDLTSAINILCATMAYNEHTAERLREELEVVADITEKKMFGDVSFVLAGNVAIGVVGNDQ